jgi:hypothetical protein
VDAPMHKVQWWLTCRKSSLLPPEKNFPLGAQTIMAMSRADPKELH